MRPGKMVNDDMLKVNELTGKDRNAVRRSFDDMPLFTRYATGIKLREYQEQVACAIARSVHGHLGLTFVVIFPRQSGKNELQAQLEAYLLTMMSHCPHESEMVKVSPTWKPQAMNAMRRLERALKKNMFTNPLWERESGYIYRIGGARIYFLSGVPTANIVGQTANVLLECDEAQDVTIEKWDKDIAPMAASTNATRVFWGTAWTSQTLLAREKRAALEAEKRDGIRRVFEIDSERVRKAAPAYGRFVDGEIAKHGRNHPFIKTQYFSEEIDQSGGMFPPERIALVRGEHDPQNKPIAGRVYAFCIDVAGSDENCMRDIAGIGEEQEHWNTNATKESENRESVAGIGGPGSSGRTGAGANHPGRLDRDRTALTIFEIVMPCGDDALPGPALPVFHIVQRRSWRGASQTTLFRQIYALADLWQPHRLVIDATGVGEGLASFLSKSFPGQVTPFKFSQASKSDLGWKLLSAIETGRFKDFAQPVNYPTMRLSNYPTLGEIATTDQAYLQQQFYQQLRACTLELAPGPGKLIRWSVPESARDESGELIHDDLLVSAALVATLSDEKGLGSTESIVIRAYDPLKEMSY